MTSSPNDDPAARDLYWAGPSGFAMLPIAITVGVVSGLSWFGVPLLARVFGLDHDWTTFILFWTILGTWILFGMHWAYRAACVVVRLTATRIYTDYGFFYRPTPAVELTSITSISAEAGPLGRFLHVGNVVIRTTNNQKVTFVGLHRPGNFVAAVQAAQAAREKANEV